MLASGAASSAQSLRRGTLYLGMMGLALCAAIFLSWQLVPSGQVDWTNRARLITLAALSIAVLWVSFALGAFGDGDVAVVDRALLEEVANWARTEALSFERSHLKGRGRLGWRPFLAVIIAGPDRGSSPVEFRFFRPAGRSAVRRQAGLGREVLLLVWNESALRNSKLPEGLGAVISNRVLARQP